ncbi:MAG: poly-beta-1,6-N-acetyl-D-glucosamine N-deacetylase PgaB [Enhydrobacter sp.]
MTRALTLAVAMLAAAIAPALAQGQSQRFVSIALHDVVDRREDLSTDAVTTDRIVALFDWMKGDGWTAISIDDVDAARLGRRPLPQKAILLSVDDGYRSLYTRIYPLLKIYRYPIVAALVGSWMAGASGEGALGDDMEPIATVRYGDRNVPRSTFISWAEAREMQASGLVEFASHSYDLHNGLLANPQGNRIPSARTWRYDAASGRYEDEAQYRARIRADLDRARRQMAAELGRPPRTMVWPFGRYTGPALDEARKAGFTHALTLDPEPADTSQPFAIHRYFPNRNPPLGEIADNLRFDVEYPESVRIACLKVDSLAAVQGAAQDEALGRVIEQIRALGPNKVVIDGFAEPPAGAAPTEAYFPNHLWPVKADILSRASWQIRSRAGADVFVRLPANAPPELWADMLRRVPADGIAVEAGALPAAMTDASKTSIRRRRAALDPATLDPQSARALQAFRAAASIAPGLRLLLSVPVLAGPVDWADYTMGPPAGDAAALEADARALRAKGMLRPDIAGHSVLTLPSAPGQQRRAILAAQRQTASAFALCPGNTPLPADPALISAFSSASFPRKP